MADFPENIVDVLKTHMVRLDLVDLVVGRSLNPNDPNMTLGVDVEEWEPDEVTMGPNGIMPTLQTYTMTLQYILKHESEEEGQKLHRKASKEIRLMLYGDDQLAVALQQLIEVSGSRRERLQIWSIVRQKFASNEISGAFVSMSVAEVRFQTETIVT